MNSKLYQLIILIFFIIGWVWAEAEPDCPPEADCRVSETDCVALTELYNAMGYSKPGCCQSPYNECETINGSTRIKKLVLRNINRTTVTIHPKVPPPYTTTKTTTTKTTKTKTIPSTISVTKSIPASVTDTSMNTKIYTTTSTKTITKSTTTTTSIQTTTKYFDPYNTEEFIYECYGYSGCTIKDDTTTKYLPMDILSQMEYLEELQIYSSFKVVQKSRNDYIRNYYEIEKIDSFINMKNLKRLYINNVGITEIPTGLKYTKLETLNLSNSGPSTKNRINQLLPQYLENMPSLKHINVAFTSIYGYPLSNVETCNYTGTGVCYVEGFEGCKTGAKQCTSSQIKKIDYEKAIENGCWANMLGYPCCDYEHSLSVYAADENGEWGISGSPWEIGQWCGIYRKEKIEIKCKAQRIGYKCCKETKEVVIIDEDGQWGVENNEWCGLD